MNLIRLLEEQKSSIVKKWVHAVFENYSGEGSNFFLEQPDQFKNPVGYILSEGIRGIYDELLRDPNSEKIFPLLNDILKIKAVQDFPPSKSLKFLLLLKQIIREEVGSEVKNRQLLDELVEYEARIDSLALLAFDLYMGCRERIYQIKVDEIRRMTFRLLQRANLICEIQEKESSPVEETVIT